MGPGTVRFAAYRELTRPSRRALLRIGGLGALGVTLPGLLRAQGEPERAGRSAEIPAHQAPRIRSCILIFYYGGPSHLDT
jgi:hypothetical protein